MSRVKSRPYDSSGRRARAEANRRAVLSAAREHFLARGYAATTVAAVAADAGVSVETVYKAFGGKAGLVRGIYEQSLAGHGPVAAYERSEAMRRAESAPRVIMAKWGDLTAEVAEVLTPVLMLIRAAAAHDAGMAALLRQVDQERLERMRHNAQFLVERGHLREGVSADHAADVMWTVSSPDLYRLLVLERGWTRQDFGRFVADTMTAALVGDP